MFHINTMDSHEMVNTEIVVVDDDENSLILLSDILSEAGYKVRPVISGALALQGIQAKAPALILLDIRMPRMDGYEVCQRLKADARTCDIPVIFISVLDQPTDKVKGFQVGGVDFITKPFENVEVLARVRTHLALRRTQLELERRVTELEATNTQLSAEINERKRVESELQRHREYLEELVAERTVELQQDIIKRKHVEEELRESEAKYRTLFESIPNGILVSGSDDKIVTANQAAASILGYDKAEDLIGVPGVELYQDVAQRDRMFARFMEQGYIPNTEFRMKKKDGSTVYTMGSGVMHRDPQGNIVRTEGIFMDITDRKRTEEALQTSKEQLYAFLNAIQETAILIDPQGIVLAANTTAAQRLGTTVENFVGACAYDFMPPEVAQYRKAHGSDIVRTGQPVQFEDRRNERMYRNILYPVKDLTGAVQNIAVLAIDITAQKQAEAALQAWATFAQMHPAPVLRFDREGRILLANSAAYDIFGYQSLHDLTMSEIFPDCPPETFVDSIQYERHVNIEVHIGGQDYYFLVCGVPALGIGHVYGSNITERKRAEEALREREERLRQITDNMEDLIARFDTHACFQYASPSYQKVLGYRPEELIGGWASQFIHPEEQAQAIQAIGAMLRSGTGSVQFRYRHKDGSYRWIESTGRNLLNAEGQVIGSVMGSRDITDRRLAEEALRRASAYNRSLIEASLDPLVMIGLDGQITDVNTATELVTGYTREDLIGTDFSDYFTEPEHARAIYQQIFRGGLVRDYPLKLRHRDGHVTSVLYNASVYRGETGQILGVFAAARDITERKLVEEALHESEERMRLAAQAANIGTYAYDFTTETLYWSPEFKAFWGYQADEPVVLDHDSLFSRLYPEDQERVLNALAAAKDPEGDGLLDFEYRVIARDGVHRWLRALGKIHFSGKTPEHAYGVIIDISNLKLAEEDLRQAKEAAEAASRVKSQFLANMSHELRTPLTNMLGYIQLLRQQQNLTDTQQHGVDIMLRNGEHLLTMINDLLDFAKTEAGKMILVNQPFALQTLLHTITASMLVQAEAKGLTFLCEYAADLPVVVSGDETHLRQILLNLLSNAIKFTERGQVALRVSNLGCEILDIEPSKAPISHQRSQIRFEVEDTGIGIPVDQLETIFDPFHQVPDDWSKPKGTGLGLSISRQLVHLMQSEIQVRSVVGQGSVFWFDLVLPVMEDDLASTFVTETDQTESLQLSPEPDLKTIVPVPIGDVSALYELARIGDIVGLRNCLTRLETSDPRWQPFVKELKTLVRDIKLQEIRAWLSKYLKEEER